MVLEASQRRTACQRGSKHRADGDYEAKELILHRLVPKSWRCYQVLVKLSVVTLVTSSRFRARRHENRPDLSRSVALVAPPHPKCPFQVVLLRARAS
jgi:hypothetical protein